MPNKFSINCLSRISRGKASSPDILCTSKFEMVHQICNSNNRNDNHSSWQMHNSNISPTQCSCWCRRFFADGVFFYCHWIEWKQNSIRTIKSMPAITVTTIDLPCQYINLTFPTLSLGVRVRHSLPRGLIGHNWIPAHLISRTWGLSNKHLLNQKWRLISLVNKFKWFQLFRISAQAFVEGSEKRKRFFPSTKLIVTGVWGSSSRNQLQWQKW